MWSSGYDARFTRERSGVRSPLPVSFFLSTTFCLSDSQIFIQTFFTSVCLEISDSMFTNSLEKLKLKICDLVQNSGLKIVREIGET